MGALPDFSDSRPAQGNTKLCGPASLACAGRYLGSKLISAFDPTSLSIAIRGAGGDFNSGGGTPKLLQLAAAWGLSATDIGGSRAQLMTLVPGLLDMGVPVLVQWRPQKLGYLHHSMNHWGVVVEWPACGEGRFRITDSCRDPVGNEHNIAMFEMSELLSRGGISARPAAISIGLTESAP